MGLPGNPDDMAICAGVVQLATAVGATCVAGDVQTRAQQAMLSSLGCDQAPGWLWAAAAPRADPAAALESITRVGTATSAPLWPLPSGEAAELVDEMHHTGAFPHTLAAVKVHGAGRTTPRRLSFDGGSPCRYLRNIGFEGECRCGDRAE
ncbi:MAG: EAL domain-containing protein [Pseudorhodobacter sp.]|nr:EAL domain-containing protein [Frankiaceae bacterium]